MSSKTPARLLLCIACIPFGLDYFYILKFRGLPGPWFGLVEERTIQCEEEFREFLERWESLDDIETIVERLMAEGVLLLILREDEAEATGLPKTA
jgi:hypothetical protein